LCLGLVQRKDRAAGSKRPVVVEVGHLLAGMAQETRENGVICDDGAKDAPRGSRKPPTGDFIGACKSVTETVVLTRLSNGFGNLCSGSDRRPWGASLGRTRGEEWRLGLHPTMHTPTSGRHEE
jgi:hypothetical protein